MKISVDKSGTAGYNNTRRMTEIHMLFSICSLQELICPTGQTTFPNGFTL